MNEIEKFKQFVEMQNIFKEFGKEMLEEIRKKLPEKYKEIINPKNVTIGLSDVRETGDTYEVDINIVFTIEVNPDNGE